MKQVKSESLGDNQICISNGLITGVLCKDIYEWCLAHIKKTILQANLTDDQIDELILTGVQNKMPGFIKYLKLAYPAKKVSFVDEEDLALGAAIVVSCRLINFLIILIL